MQRKLPRELPRRPEKAALPPPSPHTPAGVVSVSANFFDRLRAALLAILLIAAFAVPALAGPFEDAVAKFANDDFSDTDEAIGAVATSGNPLAFPIISALQDGRLSADPDTKKVFVTGSRRQDHRCRHRRRRRQAAGQRGCRPPQQPPAPHRRGRARRPDAAVARSRQADRGRAVGVQDPRGERAAVIDGALAKETNKAAKAAFTEARAAILLYKPDATEVEKLEAVAVIKATGDQEALALLTGLGQRRAAAMSRAPRPARSPRSRAISRCGRWCRTPGTACRSARCCCLPRSGLPSPSA